MRWPITVSSSGMTIADAPGTASISALRFM
jgi:hypothetical protein